MIPPPESSDGYDADFAAVLDSMVQHGWLTEWGWRGPDIVMLWTAKGRERRAWLRTLDTEIDALCPKPLSSDETMTKLRVICGVAEDFDAST